MCNRKFRDHTSELFYSLNCLKLPELISLKSLCVMYKAKNNLLPTKIQKYFVVLNTVHSHNTRSSSRDNFYCHAVRTKLKLFCLSVTGVNLWNKLDENIKQSKSLHIFKHQLKKLYKNKILLIYPKLVFWKILTGLLIKFKLYIPISSPNTEP